MLVNGVGQEPFASVAGRLSSLQFIREPANSDLHAVGFHIRRPLPSFLIPGNATMLRCGVSVAREILLTLGHCDCPQITPPVVEFVPIDVISPQRVVMRKAEYHPVQHRVKSAFGEAFGPLDIAAIQIPRPLAYQGDIGGVDDRMCPNVTEAIVQRNECGQAVFTDDRGDWRAAPAAVQRAEVFLVDFGRLAGERFSTRETANMYGHRITPGAAPRSVTSGFGARLRCSNYTSSLRVGHP